MVKDLVLVNSCLMWFGFGLFVMCLLTEKTLFIILKVVACSFVYGGVAKPNNTNKIIKQENKPKEEEHDNSEMETTPTNAQEAPVAQQTPQNFSGQGMSGWPGSGEGSVSGSGSGRSLDSSRNLLTDIDLTRG